MFLAVILIAWIEEDSVYLHYGGSEEIIFFSFFYYLIVKPVSCVCVCCGDTVTRAVSLFCNSSCFVDFIVLHEIY